MIVDPTMKSHLGLTSLSKLFNTLVHGPRADDVYFPIAQGKILNCLKKRMNTLSFN